MMQMKIIWTMISGWIVEFENWILDFWIEFFYSTSNTIFNAHYTAIYTAINYFMHCIALIIFLSTGFFRNFVFVFKTKQNLNTDSKLNCAIVQTNYNKWLDYATFWRDSIKCVEINLIKMYYSIKRSETDHFRWAFFGHEICMEFREELKNLVLILVR